MVRARVAQRPRRLLEPAGPSTPTVSAAVIWTWSMYSRRQVGSNMALAKRTAMMLWTVSFPRKWSMR